MDKVFNIADFIACGDDNAHAWSAIKSSQQWANSGNGEDSKMSEDWNLTKPAIYESAY